MSKFKPTREQKIGLFAIVTLLSLYITVNYLKGKDLFSNRNTYYSYFHDVEGLTPTGPVYIRGLKVGTIEDIAYNPQSDNFTITMKVSNRYRIPSNSVATAYSADLLGTKAVKIEMGDNSGFLSNKGTMVSSSQAGMVEMITAEFKPILNDISNLIQTLDTTLNNINSVIDQDARRNIAGSLSNLNATLEATRRLAQSLGNSGPQINEVISNVNQLTSQLNQGTTSLNRSLDNVSRITDSLSKADLAGTVNSFKVLLEKLSDPDGSVGKLISSDTLHNSVEELIKELDQLIGNINSNPKKYIRISVF